MGTPSGDFCRIILCIILSNPALVFGRKMQLTGRMEVENIFRKSTVSLGNELVQS